MSFLWPNVESVAVCVPLPLLYRSLWPHLLACLSFASLSSLLLCRVTVPALSVKFHSCHLIEIQLWKICQWRLFAMNSVALDFLQLTLSLGWTCLLFWREIWRLQRCWTFGWLRFVMMAHYLPGCFGANRFQNVFSDLVGSFASVKYALHSAHLLWP